MTPDNTPSPPTQHQDATTTTTVIDPTTNNYSFYNHILTSLMEKLLNGIYVPKMPRKYASLGFLQPLSSSSDLSHHHHQHQQNPLSVPPHTSLTKSQYDQLHHYHISSHTGATYFHITLLTCIFFLLTLYLGITLKNACFQRKRNKFLSKSYLLLFVAEFLSKIFLFVLVVFQRIQSHVSLLMLNVFLFGLIVMLYVHKARHQQFHWFSRRKITLLENQSQKTFISEFRSQMMILTCICILAVDFRDFVDGYFKVDEWGIGLMDTGVALFVFSSGLVSLAARKDQYSSLERRSSVVEGGEKNVHDGRDASDSVHSNSNSTTAAKSTTTLRQRQSSSHESTNSDYKKSSSTSSNSHHRKKQKAGPFLLKVLRHAAPLLVLGLVRFATVWAADYQAHAHVSEYGIHWNFFFTLACISIFVNVADLFLASFGAIHYLGLAITTALIQQGLLMMGMEQYIFEAPRTNFFSANKEGICSLLGYLSIHYFAVAIGRLIFSSSASSQLENSSTTEHNASYYIFKARWKFVAKVIFGSTLLLWVIHLFTVRPDIVGGPALFQKLLQKINIPSKLIHDEQLLRSLTVPSRRLLNLPYILWCVTLALSVLGATLFFDLSIDRITRQNLLRDAINQNSLVLFLFANVLTGSINLIVKTLLVRDLVGILIVTGYMLAICGLAVFLREKKITIRL